MVVFVMEKKEWIIFSSIISIFLFFYLIPLGFFEKILTSEFWLITSLVSGLELLSDYAKLHVLTCLIPALFIAGAITVFIRKEKVLKYLGSDANKYLSFLIASVSGTILAVCSCTILPLFAGIRKRGAGLGPAITFLFAGPAINIAAIFLTMSVLGFKIGIARVIFAIIISILVGVSMFLIFREKIEKGNFFMDNNSEDKVSNIRLFIFFGLMISILVVNGLKIDVNNNYAIQIFNLVFTLKIMILLLLAIITIIYSFKVFGKDLRKLWVYETWTFSKIILPLLFVGVFVAGFIMPLLPESLIVSLVGKNSILGNMIASVFGAFMYFSTLTEIPILQAFLEKGMHHGPALALLLAGPSLSLPNMLVIRSVIGNKKTIVYVSLVIFYSTIAGLIFGLF
jgi:uncharacterized protein